MENNPGQILGRVLITGGAGFIGLSLAWRLRNFAQVVLLDSLCHDPDVQTLWASGSGAKLVAGDVRDEHILMRAMDGCTSIVHLASLAGVERVRANPAETEKTIVDGTSSLIAACKKSPTIQKVVLVSSSEVYGVHADRNDEDDLPSIPDDGDPRWVYAASKLAAEKMVLRYGDKYGLDVSVLRPFNVYGPGQLGAGAVGTFVKRALAQKPLYVLNDGMQVRAWCFVSDLLRAMVAVLESERRASRIYNIGNPDAALTTYELARKIVGVAGSSSTIRIRSTSEPEVRFRVPNIDRARGELGYCPEVGLEEGIKYTVDWFGCCRGSVRAAPWEGDFGL